MHRTHAQPLQLPGTIAEITEKHRQLGAVLDHLDQKVNGGNGDGMPDEVSDPMVAAAKILALDPAALKNIGVTSDPGRLLADLMDLGTRADPESRKTLMRVAKLINDPLTRTVGITLLVLLGFGLGLDFGLETFPDLHPFTHILSGVFGGIVFGVVGGCTGMLIGDAVESAAKR